MTLSMCRKIFSICFCAFAFVSFVNAEESLFAKTFKNFSFFSNEEVLKAYEGSWSGSQEVKFGDINATGRISQTYTATQSRLVGVGKITSSSGRSAPTASYMYIENGMLILEMRTERGSVSYYKGIIDDNSVIWIPIYDFFVFDFQQDFFYEENGKQVILALGKRLFSVQGKSGVLEINSKMEKLKNSYPVSEVNSAVQQKMKIDAKGGIKFGK